MEILHCSLVNMINNTLVTNNATLSSLFLSRFSNSVDGGMCYESDVIPRDSPHYFPFGNYD
jgi:hypothetical protein